MSELPKGWSSKLLGELAETITKGTTPTTVGYCFETEGVPFVKVENIDSNRIQHSSIYQYISDEAHAALSRSAFQAGDVLFSIAGTIGKTALITPSDLPCNTNQAIAIIRGTEKVLLPLYLKYNLSYRAQEIFMANARGGAMNNVSLGDLKKTIVAIPPLAEQKRIVDKLDEVLAQVDTIKARLDGIPALLKRFRQSVLASAVSGKLTEEWRGENQNALDTVEIVSTVSKERKARGFKAPRNVEDVTDVPFSIPDYWAWLRAGDLCLKITDGAHNTPKLVESGFPYLMAKDLTGGQLDFSENRLISEKDHRELYNKCQPEIGDLLVVNIGAGTGNNVLVNVDYEFSFKNIAILKRSTHVLPSYFKYFFDSQKKRIFDEQTRGGAQPFLSLTILNNLLIALPSIEEQKEIVRLVDEYFAFADTIEAQVKKAQARVDNLTQSILAKAFRGELVPQDPNDEPADKLLERISVARKEAEALAKAAKKAGATKKKVAKSA
ncbi:restriction endonuclease subunit S [Vibrio vulnificus]